MKCAVNPFEPWRPVEARIPPPLHVGRPWRPASSPPVRPAVEELPLVEPVAASGTASGKVPPQRPRKPPQEQGKPPSPVPTATPMAQLTALIALVVFGLLCLDGMGWYRSTHTPRLLVLGTSAGIFLGMVFHGRRSWYKRLRGMAIALALAGIALWLVPTTQGVSLWSAYRYIEELRALPAGDVAGYQRGAAGRRTLVEDFPSFAAEVSAAEQAWFRRTVDEAVENADQQMKNDPETALAYLQQLDQDLSRLEHYALVRKDLESARRRAAQACLKVAQPR